MTLNILERKVKSMGVDFAMYRGFSRNHGRHFPKFWYMAHFELAPSMRGKGIGREAVRLIKTAATVNAIPLCLFVEGTGGNSTAGAMKFWRKMGFKQNGGKRRMIWVPETYRPKV